MKQTKRCPKCGSRRVGHLERILDQQGDGEDGNQKIGKVAESLYSFTVRTATGETEAYVCADCGYFETYVKSPETIAWDDMEAFSWVDPEASRGG